MILFYNYIDAYSYKSCNTANPFHPVNTRVHKTYRKNYGGYIKMCNVAKLKILPKAYVD